MTYEAVEVNHRNLIEVIEAVSVLKKDKATLENIAEYCDITKDSTEKALKMAGQLRFVEQSANVYIPVPPFSRLFTNANMKEKKAILKFKLLEHEPFTFFARLVLKGEDATKAIYKTKSVFNISGSTTILKNTFLDLGGFSGIFTETEKGVEARFEAESEMRSVFESIGGVLNEEAQIGDFIESQLNEFVSEYVENLKQKLVTAAKEFSSKPKACIKDTADVFEDFLKKMCADESVDITGAGGIIEIGDRLKSAGKITTKHQGFIYFIGQMRNAFKHTTDSEIGKSWKASTDLSFGTFLITLEAINSITLYVKRKECVL